MQPRTTSRIRSDAPLYGYAEADYLCYVGPGTSKRWIEGYGHRDSRGERVNLQPVSSRERGHAEVSFLDLVEVAAIGGLRREGFPLKRIRQIVAYCRNALEIDRPLVTLKFKTDGRQIFIDRGAALLEVGEHSGNQAWAEILEPFLKELDYEDDLARRWYPMGRDGSISIDPDYGFGLPTVAGAGVRTEILLERFQVGENTEEIAEDFAISPTQVEQAIRYETRLAKRAA
ncbi:MAG: DUF433 domain-containing protein [Chloroflexota bacterium]